MVWIQGGGGLKGGDDGVKVWILADGLLPFFWSGEGDCSEV